MQTSQVGVENWRGKYELPVQWVDRPGIWPL